ncbi:hypothetical protein J1605_013413 [Eschrichtius robustus]|uniref:Uncharacterized protein n=1 Tax=Eschrichtius robustus TaxID=9764 RepID=A0AB34GF96_ESCRO|nr:hypothetical protein J1605_013413 [Eschrichtius robustus]
MRSSRTATKSSPCSPQLEKPDLSSSGPSIPGPETYAAAAAAAAAASAPPDLHTPQHSPRPTLRGARFYVTQRAAGSEARLPPPSRKSVPVPFSDWGGVRSGRGLDELESGPDELADDRGLNHSLPEALVRRRAPTQHVRGCQPGPAGQGGPPLVSGNVAARQLPTLTTTFPLRKLRPREGRTAQGYMESEHPGLLQPPKPPHASPSWPGAPSQLG